MLSMRMILLNYPKSKILLETRWQLAPISQIESHQSCVYEQMGDILLELSECSFPKVGSLVASHSNARALAQGA